MVDQTKRIEPFPIRFIACPNCGKGEHRVEHLFSDGLNRRFGPWQCDLCDNEFFGHAREDGTIEVESIRPQEGESVFYLTRFRDLYVVIGPYRYSSDEHSDFFVHSHQCPTNLMRNALEAFDPADGQDPHGVFRLIARLPATSENRKAIQDAGKVAVLFRLFNTDGQESPTEWPEENGGVISWIADLSRTHQQAKMPKA